MEGLCHLPQEVLGHLHPLVHRQVEVGICEVLLDPAGQLSTLVRPGEPLRTAKGKGCQGPPLPRHRGVWGAGRAPTSPYLVSEDHQAIVGFAPDGPAHALGRVAHGIEGEKVILPDLELVPQVLQPCLGGPSCVY